MKRPVRVLLCDDSAFARKVLRDVLAQEPSIEVVGTARDGLDALEKIASLRPDVITLDLVMPHLDGLGLLAELGADGPRVVVVSSSAEDSDLVIRALQAGAITSVQKPTALATERLYDIGSDVIRAVLLAGDARPAATAVPAAIEPVPVRSGAALVDLVALGASTGGPRALTRVLEALPGDFPVPLALVVHMPVGYTDAFARRLDETCALEIIEAHDGLELRRGRVVVARAGMHLAVMREHGQLVARLEVQPLDTPHRPSVDVLFRTAARAGRVLGVVLTGMGSDGLAGARAIREAGGEVLAESASSCVVYGMPRSVVEAGLATASAPIDRMAALITAHATEPT